MTLLQLVPILVLEFSTHLVSKGRPVTLLISLYSFYLRGNLIQVVPSYILTVAWVANKVVVKQDFTGIEESSNILSIELGCPSSAWCQQGRRVTDTTVAIEVAIQGALGSETSAGGVALPYTSGRAIIIQEVRHSSGFISSWLQQHAKG